jgi:hypothetical protein
MDPGVRRDDTGCMARVLYSFVSTAIGESSAWVLEDGTHPGLKMMSPCPHSNSY